MISTIIITKIELLSHFEFFSLQLIIFISNVFSALRAIRKTWSLHSEKFEDLNIKLLLDPLTPLSDLDQPHILCHVSQRLCPGKGSYRLTIMQKQVSSVKFQAFDVLAVFFLKDSFIFGQR